jgi:hypothetical protein
MALLTEENAAEYLPLLVTDGSKHLQMVIDPGVLKSSHLDDGQVRSPIRPPDFPQGRALGQLTLELLDLVLSDSHIPKPVSFQSGQSTILHGRDMTYRRGRSCDMGSSFCQGSLLKKNP